MLEVTSRSRVHQFDQVPSGSTTVHIRTPVTDMRRGSPPSPSALSRVRVASTSVIIDTSMNLRDGRLSGLSRLTGPCPVSAPVSGVGSPSRYTKLHEPGTWRAGSPRKRDRNEVTDAPKRVGQSPSKTAVHEHSQPNALAPEAQALLHVGHADRRVMHLSHRFSSGHGLSSRLVLPIQCSSPMSNISS